MAMAKARSQRLSINVDHEEHRKIKIASAFCAESISSYVLKAVQERLREDLEHHGLIAMSANADPVLAELWNNEKDSAYDKL
jgi:uncharacterized protein (DUF1778 family)